MPSQCSEASWHPAFMPNKAEDIITMKSTPSISSPTSPTLDSPIEYTKPEPSTPPPEHEMHQVADEKQNGFSPGSIGDNTNHPELSNLRSALETSLASPGGVEMDERPQENGDSPFDGSGEYEDERAEFPSEGPSHEGKHLSTMSFARTVSHEVNWGEDDDVDPEWTLSRRDTDPFKSMAQSDRTNSFPAVPPAHIPEIPQPLPQTEASDIMNNVEQETRDLFSDDGNDVEADFFAQQSSPVAANHTPFQDQEVKEDHNSGEYGQAYGTEVLHEDEEDSQARYEEGIPLVPKENNSTENHEPVTNHAAFMDHDEGEEDDFFAQVSKSDEVVDDAPKPQLERKSTVQVMDALNFHPRHQTRPSVVVEADEENFESLIHPASGGGISASRSTAFSQAVSDVAMKPDTSEGDLAAKWQAALAEDEFLGDDDGFLPDEEATTELDPSAVFGSDDEGFLEDTDDHASPPIPAAVTGPNGHTMGFDSLTGSAHAHANRPTSSSSTNSRYMPTGQQFNVPGRAPSFGALGAGASTGQQFNVPGQTLSSGTMDRNFLPQPPKPELPKAQSFANKSKGGYESPYDLPMEVVKPRKRQSMNQIRPAAAVPNVPPRGSFSYGQRPPPSRGSTSSLSPPPSSHSMQPSQLSSSAGTAPLSPVKTIRKSQSGFFEELPMTHKPKPAARHSNSLGTSPIINQYGQPPSAPPSGTLSYTTPMQGQSTTMEAPPSTHGLVAPQKMNPYALLPSANVPTPPTGSRYSPATNQQNQIAPPPVSQARYSPAPPPRQTIPSYGSQTSNPPQSVQTQILQHQPRTSSPLAHFERGLDGRSRSTHSDRGTFDRRSSSSHESNLKPYHLPPTREVDESDAPTQSHPKNYGDLQTQYTPHPVTHPALSQRQVSPPTQTHEVSSRYMASPKRPTSSYTSQNSLQSPPPQYHPLQRSQTQSPGAKMAASRIEMSKSDPYHRPTSTELPPSPRANSGPAAMPTTYPFARARGHSQAINYIAPTDGREHDPLQRWKGAPVFAWGVGGSIMTSFPKDVPRYGINQSVPMIVRSPGEVKIRNIKDIDPLPARLTSFPGPLKGKSKKKDVITWLTAGIAILEQDATYLRTVSHLSHEDKRTEERILLWKILRVFIEYDGILEGNPTIDKAVRAVLSPGLDDLGSATAPLYATGAELSGISHSSATATRADPVDPAAVDSLRKHLLCGEREKAVWEAVDKRLWAHAMLISNTVSRDLYKRVCQEFVQKEVKNIGDNTEPLAALYEIFAGNFEESIDELVPPSARAGFQMVSTSNALSPSKDAMDGLDRWRETLGLVLSNRSVDDSQALNALGKLLSGYGRAEAAHICFLFARTFTVFGGIDDPASSFVLVGSDHLRQPYEFDREMEPILLSEAFEYGMSLANPSALLTSSPHLAIYKLQHAKILAEYGYRDKALQYCETIGASIYSQTRRSPYHHPLLIAELEDLSKRLKSSPKDDSASWISKPSIDKAKGSVWATFNKFVAGEETESTSSASNTENANDIGPFARIAGGTPTISRSPSVADIYGDYGNGSVMNGSAAGAGKPTSRYAPGAPFSSTNEPQSATSYGSQPRSSLEGRGSNEYQRYQPQRGMSQMSDYRPSSQPSGQAAIPSPLVSQTSSSYTPQSTFGQYAQAPPVVNQLANAPKTPTTDLAPNGLYSSPQPINSFEGYRASSSYAPTEMSSRQPSSTYEPFANTFEPQAAGPQLINGAEGPDSNAASSYGSYEPPTGSYEPPSYQPATMDDDPDSPVEKPKKKSFMDDDDDDDIPGLKALKSESAPREKTKAEKDKEVEEAFRKAAEADAEREKEKAAPAKKGWGLGGWFGGGAKKESTDMGAQPNKPIRAKLGEASSFVYDPDLKRWINKKPGADNTDTSHTATPPPPKATGPPRMHNGPNSSHLTSPPRSSSMGPPQNRHISNLFEPPQRPGTSAGDGPVHEKTGPHGALVPPMMMRSVSNTSSQGSAPPSRPGTSMSNTSSIDDLLAGAGPRKAGGKGAAKRRGRGYIDVMGEKAGAS